MDHMLNQERKGTNFPSTDMFYYVVYLNNAKLPKFTLTIWYLNTITYLENITLYFIRILTFNNIT